MNHKATARSYLHAPGAGMWSTATPGDSAGRRRRGRSPGAGHTRGSCHFAITAVFLTTALVASACQWPPGVASDPVLTAMLGGGSVQARAPGRMPDADGSGGLVDRVYVEARARLAAAGGAVEVSARVNATALNWQPQDHLFDYPDANIGDWWTSTPIGPADAGISTVRIRARRLPDGGIELAFLTRTGQEVHPREPRLAYAALATDDWTYATPVVLTAEGEPAPTGPPADADSDRFVEVSVGRGSVCGLRADLTIRCWGSDSGGRASPPQGTFVALESGYPCAIRTDGTQACWPHRSRRAGPFIAISTSCGIRPDGRLDCGEQQRDDAPSGEFASITSGPGYSDPYRCGLHLSGEVACWGGETTGPRLKYPFVEYEWAKPPGGSFTAVAAGLRHICGIRVGGSAQCWGDDHWGQSSVPTGPFAALSAGRTFSCGLRPDGHLECWGGRLPEFTRGGLILPTHSEHAPAPPPSGVFTAVHSSNQGSRDERTCALRTDGSVECWYPAAIYPPRFSVLFDFTKADGYGRWQKVYDTSHIPAGAFRALHPGGRHACGLRVDRSVACWGNDHRGQATAPGGTFDSLNSGGHYTCALRADGTVQCWGDDGRGQASPPAGPFSKLSTGWEHACALDPDRSVVCWGDDSAGQARPPTGPFETVAAGGRHSCAIRTEDKSVTCWGSDSQGQSKAPRGEFNAISLGALHSCGLRADRTAVCWGDSRFGQSSAPDGAFETLEAGSDYTCGLRTGGTIACWGGDQEQWGVGLQHWTIHNPPPASPPPRPFVALSAGSQIACAVRSDGSGECWIATGLRTINTPPDLTATRAPNGAFLALSAGAYHTCAIDTDDTLACWGENTDAQSTPPPGTYRAVSAGERHTCAIDTDHGLTCWGDNTFGQSSAPAGKHLEVGAGNRHTCAIGSDQRLACWGDNTYQQSTPPSWRYRAVTAGERHTCAITIMGTVQCWGDNTHQQTDAPRGTYSDITAGRFGTCALRPNNTVACWGLTIRDETDSPRTAPAGTFTTIDAGTRHTCGIRPNNQVECWPEYGNSSGDRYEAVATGQTWADWYPWRDSRAEPLPGPFIAVSAGTYHTCGIRPDGATDCWSAYEPRTDRLSLDS